MRGAAHLTGHTMTQAVVEGMKAYEKEMQSEIATIMHTLGSVLGPQKSRYYGESAVLAVRDANVLAGTCPFESRVRNPHPLPHLRLSNLHHTPLLPTGELMTHAAEFQRAIAQAQATER